MLDAVFDVLTKDIELKGLQLGSSNAKEHTKVHSKVAKDTQNNVAAKSVEAKAKVEQAVIKKDLPCYDYTLISSLRDENEKLRFVYDQVMHYAIENEFEKATGRLEELNTQIRQHYLKADVELYAYLKTFIQLKYPKREKAFTELSLQMKNISMDIFYAISQSPNLPLTKKTHAGFMKEFIKLGKLLSERIKREEDVLFPMYESTNAATSIS